MNLATFDLNLLKTLNSLLRTNSISKTAEDLGLTQSAISHALNRLRDITQDPLFIRVGHSMVPSDFALEIQKDIAVIIEDLESLLDRQKSFSPEKDHIKFHIGISEYGSFTVLPKLLNILRLKAPNVQIITHHASRYEGEDRLLNNEFDLLIGSTQASAKALDQIRLFDEEFVLIGHKENPLLKTNITKNTYLTHPQINVSLAGEKESFVDRFLQNKKASRNIKHTVSNYLLAFNMAENSDFLISEPYHLYLFWKNKFKLTHSALPYEMPSVPIHATYHMRKRNNEAFQWLIEQLRACFKDH